MYNNAFTCSRGLYLLALASFFAPTIALAQSGGMAGMPGMSHVKADTQKTILTMMAPGPLGIGQERLGSGTSWLPDRSSMRAYHWTLGKWSLMGHGDIDLIYDKQGGPRGDTRFVSGNWFMLMAMRPLGSGQLHLNAMGSIEPWTVGSEGYPLLLQTGETNNGQPLKDHQHPHDMFMELAARYEVPLSQSVALSLYAAPVGEPAMGPVAFMHRPAAQGLATAPLGHHWQDATHITFGVLTAGLYTRRVKLEGSLFNGREPDENRYGLDLRKLDSWSTRVSWNPDSAWALMASYGLLKSPEAATPERSQGRINASIQHSSPIGGTGELALALTYGANKDSDQAKLSQSAAFEGNLEFSEHHTIFWRAEVVQKSAEELVLAGFPLDQRFVVSALTAGFLHEFFQVGKTTVAIGAAGTVNMVPSSLATVYGSRHPLGLTAYLRIRPALMGKHDPNMAGMQMGVRGRP